MNSAPRVLIVTPVFTHPPRQGNAARILAFGRELKARGFCVEVVHYCLDNLPPGGDEAMRQEWSDVHLIPARPHKAQRHATHWGLDDWCHDDVTRTVARLCMARRYAAVIVNYVWMSRCLLEINGPLRIIDTHDLFGDRHLISIASGLEPNWYFTSTDEETAGFDRADLVIGIQSRETARIATRTRARTITVGHPIPAWFLTTPSSAYSAAEFGYFASANPWNVRSLDALDSKLAQRFADCDWSIAGTICRALRRLRTRPFQFGAVNDPADFYRHVGCCINPMIGGTGLKIKTIEAMAYGCPVIGTVDAFEGLPAIHPMHTLSDLTAMVEAMREFCGSPNLQVETLVATRELHASYTSETNRQYDQLADLIRGRVA
jgi:hypothetical protein